MAARIDNLKPIGDLRDDDLRRHPMWCFAEDAEGEEGQDETSVEPVEGTHVPLWRDPIFVATRLVASDGCELLGLVHVSSDPDTRIEPCAIVTSEMYAPLPGTDDSMAESVLCYTESELGKTRQTLYPLVYTLCVPIEGEEVARSGQFDLPSVTDA